MLPPRLRAIGLALLILLAAPSAPGWADDPAAKGRPAAPASDVAAVLERLTKAYAEAETYQDVGELVDLSKLNGNVMETRARFATKFARPDRWLFDGRESLGDGMPPNRFTSWSTGAGQEYQTRIGDQPPVRHGRTQFGQSLMDGSFTSGIAKVAPSLLGPTDKYLPPDLLRPERQWKLSGSEKVGGADCYVLVGVEGDEEKTTMRLWVDKKTNLARRYKEVGGRPGFAFDRTITLQPTINEPIDPSAFEPRNDQAPAKKSGTAKKPSRTRKNP